MDAAVFLDRDDTLIANDGDLGEPERVRLIHGVSDGLRALREAGYRLIVVTNQAGVARGRFTEEDVDAVHQRVSTLVDDGAGGRNIINRFYYCPYHPQAEIAEYRRDHPWRKPHPGMLLQAARDLNLDLASSWMIGDQRRDVEAGRSAGCRTVLVSEDESLIGDAQPTTAASSFGEAVQAVLRQTPPRTAAPAEKSTPPAGAGDDGLGRLKRPLDELPEELRTERLHRREFTAVRVAAAMCQLFAMLLALLGLLQLGSTDLFIRWMLGAALVQLLAITLLVADLKT